jgi:hypothetical protein
VEYKKIISLRPHHIGVLEDILLKGKYYVPMYLGKKAETYWNIISNILIMDHMEIGFKFVENLDGLCLRCEELLNNRCSYGEFKDLDDRAVTDHGLVIGKVYSAKEIKELIYEKKKRNFNKI